MTTTLRIEGMHCNSCKILIEDVCNEIPGVQSSEVHIEQGQVTIEHEPDLDIARVKDEIAKLGNYHVTLV